MTVEIKLDEAKWKRAETILREFPNGVTKGMRPALKAGINAFRESAKSEITSVYAISRGNAQKEGQVRAAYYETAATITYNGHKIALHDFTSHPAVPIQRALVYGQQIRGGGGNFPSAFVVRMRSGHVGIFERNIDSPHYDGRSPTKEIMGVAEAQMVDRSDIYEEAERQARETAQQALDEAISAVINSF